MSALHELKREPFGHQREELEAHGRDEVRAVFWEQGTGKTWLIVNEFADLYLAGEVDSLLVVAPNGVHRNWVSDELPADFPDDLLERTRCHIWQAGKASTKWHAQAYEATRQWDRGPAVLVMSYDALMTEPGRKAAKRFLLGRKVLYVLDESARIKNPNAKRTKRILNSKDYATYRRILTGTPVANSPFDVYSQLKFLKPDVWGELGISNFAAFKQYFGVWSQRANRGTGRTFPYCEAYRNLDVLHDYVQRFGSRVCKDEVLDLPPKLFSTRYFDLAGEQARVYRELRDDYVAELDSGEELTAPLALVRLLRLQQVVCGYLPMDDGLRGIDGPNPRLDLLAEVCEDIPHKAIVWCRFRRDVDLACRLLGERAVRYDGPVKQVDRERAIEEFQRGDAQFFVANPATISEGVTLHAARTVIRYSNSFKLTERLQSDDRAHRIGQEHPVSYIDLVAQGTVDEHIVTCLREKLDVASQVTGDTLREWL